MTPGISQRLFLTGGTSLLGAALLSKIPFDWEIILAEHKNKNVFPQRKNIKVTHLDVADIKNVFKTIDQLKPSLFLHAAALSNVDFCQKHQKEARRINVEGTRNIVKACEKNRIPLLFISSNAVFDGAKKIYSEEDKPHPVNFYGKTKNEGEKIVEESSLSWKIVRLITMYGWPPSGARQNPVTWTIEKLQNGEKLEIVSDVRLNPLYNHDAAGALWTIIKKGLNKNVYHVAGSEVVNRYQWALETAKVFGFDPLLISPVPSSFFDRKIAPRPPQTIYSIEKIKRELGFIPRGVREGLMAMRDEKRIKVS